ncbi:hypothetical protein [Jeotgalibacillus sp. R-1-5s-1]|uniref:hypothetical protein n=1 Tax=Jeotgalibacillus sp. R-1-5s-1 TaxID=2555897 RepID=UPI00106A46E5|nr:hypothetical protein [Jeotgalibacillus sp. R-1-5s-1]TFE00847.1 hypothetical protein E2491_04880 [Jeotgalibacillus sp. R-1-5s-1]
MKENHLITARLWGLFSMIAGGIFLFFAPGIGSGVADWWVAQSNSMGSFEYIYQGYITVFIVFGAILLVLGVLIWIASLAVSLYGKERLEQEESSEETA